MKHKNDEVINALLEKFNLSRDEDVFEKIDKRGRFQYRIIPRRGIDKVEAMSKARVTFEVIKCAKDHVVLKFTATKEEEDGTITIIETTGEADDGNVQQIPKYLAAMAESRGRARAILKIEGFYKYGFFSEDEADEFKSFSNEKRGIKAPKKEATVRTGISEETFPDFLKD